MNIGLTPTTALNFAEYTKEYDARILQPFRDFLTIVYRKSQMAMISRTQLTLPIAPALRQEYTDDYVKKVAKAMGEPVVMPEEERSEPAMNDTYSEIDMGTTSMMPSSIPTFPSAFPPSHGMLDSNEFDAIFSRNHDVNTLHKPNDGNIDLTGRTGAGISFDMAPQSDAAFQYNTLQFDTAPPFATAPQFDVAPQFDTALQFYVDPPFDAAQAPQLDAAQALQLDAALRLDAALQLDTDPQLDAALRLGAALQLDADLQKLDAALQLDAAHQSEAAPQFDPAFLTVPASPIDPAFHFDPAFQPDAPHFTHSGAPMGGVSAHAPFHKFGMFPIPAIGIPNPHPPFHQDAEETNTILGSGTGAAAIRVDDSGDQPDAIDPSRSPNGVDPSLVPNTCAGRAVANGGEPETKRRGKGRAKRAEEVTTTLPEADAPGRPIRDRKRKEAAGASYEREVEKWEKKKKSNPRKGGTSA